MRGQDSSSDLGAHSAIFPCFSPAGTKDSPSCFPLSQDSWSEKAQSLSEGTRSWQCVSPTASAFLSADESPSEDECVVWAPSLSASTCAEGRPAQLTPPLLCLRAYVSLPQFFSLNLSLFSDKGPHLQTQPSSCTIFSNKERKSISL